MWPVLSLRKPPRKSRVGTNAPALPVTGKRGSHCRWVCSHTSELTVVEMTNTSHHKSGNHGTLAKPFRDLFWVESVRVPDGQERNRLVGDHSVDRLVTDLQNRLQFSNGQGVGYALDSISNAGCISSLRIGAAKS